MSSLGIHLNLYCISLPSICPVASAGSSSEAEQNAALTATQNCQGPRAREMKQLSCQALDGSRVKAMGRTCHMSELILGTGN